MYIRKIYISSSWRNRLKVRQLALLLRNQPYLEVFDFTDPTNRKEEICPPERYPELFDPDKHIYSRYLNKPEWRACVFENRQRIDECDWVILLLPCGIDATADWAYAVGAGKRTAIVGHPKKGDRSPVHLWAEFMFEDIDAVIGLFR